MQMRPVVSTNVRAAGYDDARRVLRVEFASGGVYDYRGISSDLAAQMFEPFPWRRVGHLVKAHPFDRIA